MSLFQQLIQFLSSPPDSLVYHIVTLLALQATLALALWQYRRQPDDKFARRLAWASGGIIVARLLFLFASLAVANPEESAGLLPPLERAVDAVTVALLVWALAPHPRGLPHLGDVILIILLLVIILMYAFFAQEWMAEVEAGPITRGYAVTQQAAVWDLFHIGLLLTGSILILLAKEADWTLRLTILLLLAVFHVASLFYQPAAGQVTTDVAYWVRLGNLIVFPLLVVLTYRHSLSHMLPAGRLGRFSPDQFTFLMDHVREVILSPELETTVHQSLNLTAAIFGSNLSAIAIDQGDNQEELTLYGQWVEVVGQSAVESKNAQLMYNNWPSLKLAMNSQEQSVLFANGQGARQLHNLCQKIAVHDLGSALVTPLCLQDSTLGILLLARSSDRYHWSPEEKALAISVAEFLAQAIHNTKSDQRVDDPDGRLSDGEADLPNKMLTEATFAAAVNQAAAGLSQERFTELEHEIEALSDSLAEAENALKQAANMDSKLSADWIMRTVTRYSGELETAETQIQSLETKIAEQLDVESYSSISSQISALRTPLTAMSVYTELLIGEGQTLSRSKQKSLLHRMKVNTDYLAVVVEDLARFVRSAKPRWSVDKPVDIKETIEESVSTIGALQRRKQLKLDLIVDDDLPQLHTPDRAFRQIMTYLLTSACFYTAANGRISITVHKDNLYESSEKGAQGSATFLHVAIIGQPTSMRQGSNNRLTGMASASPIEETKEINQGVVRQELSLARELVSKCHGRIWIDLESRSASQFSFLIPLAKIVSVKAK